MLKYGDKSITVKISHGIKDLYWPDPHIQAVLSHDPWNFLFSNWSIYIKTTS